MWQQIMTLPDGAEIFRSLPSDGGDLAAGPTYQVNRRGKKIGDFAELHDIALFVRYRHDQATYDAFITAEQRLASSPKSGRVRARTC